MNVARAATTTEELTVKRAQDSMNMVEAACTIH